MLPDATSAAAVRTPVRDAPSLMARRERTAVTTFDCRVYEPAPCFVMPLLAGSALRDRARRCEAGLSLGRVVSPQCR